MMHLEDSNQQKVQGYQTVPGQTIQAQQEVHQVSYLDSEQPTNAWPIGNLNGDENPYPGIPQGSLVDEPEMPPIVYKGETFTKYKVSLDEIRDLPHSN